MGPTGEQVINSLSTVIVIIYIWIFYDLTKTSFEIPTLNNAKNYAKKSQKISYINIIVDTIIEKFKLILLFIILGFSISILFIV